MQLLQFNIIDHVTSSGTVAIKHETKNLISIIAALINYNLKNLPCMSLAFRNVSSDNQMD
jgi:hypothetical protein